MSFSPVNSSQCSSTVSHLSRFGVSLLSCFYLLTGDMLVHILLWLSRLVSQQQAQMSLSTKPVQSRDSRGFELAPSFNWKWPGSDELPDNIAKLSFPPPPAPPGCESVGVWEGGSCHCEELFRRGGNYSFPSLLVRICLMYCYT